VPEFAVQAGLLADPNVASDTGVIAQDVQRVLPEAVHAAGDIILPSGQRIDNFLVVNKVCNVFIPVACAECDDSLPFSGAASIPL
jgi:hypothetical protein